MAALQFRHCCGLQNFTDQSFWAFVDFAKQSFCVITCDWLNTYCSTLLLYVLRILLWSPVCSFTKKNTLILKLPLFHAAPTFLSNVYSKEPFQHIASLKWIYEDAFFICMERRVENHLVKISYWFPIQVDLAQTNEHRWGHSGIPANISASLASSLS